MVRGRRPRLEEGRADYAFERGIADLRRLKVIGVFVPIAAVLVLEVVRVVVFELHFEGDSLGHAVREQLAPALLTVVAVVAFALVMFAFIERAQREIVRQNRELGAVNAVSTAVQGELAVDEVIDAVMESVIGSTGASEVSVTVFDEEIGAAGNGAAVRRAAAPTPPAAAGAAPPHLVDVPLSTTTRIVGRMRLQLPAGVSDPDLLAATTLQNIGHQLGASIQTAQLVADLQRRQREGHALYEVLVQISNQGVLADILAMIVRHARDRLAGDEAAICLNGPSAHLVQSDARELGSAVEGAAGVCICSELESLHAFCGSGRSCSIRSTRAFQESASVAIASGEAVLGDLWVGRRAGPPFTGRDREYLATLSDLASIAITSARMREGEHLAAIRGERERIARELHDSLAQVLGVTQLRLRALLGGAEIQHSDAISAELAELAEICGDAYHDVRESILGLRESSRPDRGLVESLAAHLEKYQQQSGIRTSLETELDGELILPPLSEIQVIRVVQEALTNVRKHSGATAVTVRIAEAAGRVTFVIEDDGNGFDPRRAAIGRDAFGLQSMRERVGLIGGILVVEAAPGRGTRITAEVPPAYHPTSA